MKIKDFKAILDSTDIPWAWDHFKTKTKTHAPPNPPFMCYLLPNSADFYADGINYSRAEVVNIELYTDAYDPETENKVITALTENDISFSIARTWLDDENMEMTVFSFELNIEVNTDGE